MGENYRFYDSEYRSVLLRVFQSLGKLGRSWRRKRDRRVSYEKLTFVSFVFFFVL